MKVAMKSTDEIVQFNGVPTRVWHGVTDKGCRFLAFMAGFAVEDGQDCTEFTTELVDLAEIPIIDYELPEIEEVI